MHQSTALRHLVTPVVIPAARTWLKASIRTDLPAPLSPVMTFKPGLKETHCSAIKAKFLHQQARVSLGPH